MIATLVTMAFAVLAFAVLVLAARGNARAKSVEDVMTQAQKVDLAAFRNLTDAAEERYLRTQLRGRDFRKIHRQRMFAAAGYVRRTAHNAALLMRLGQAARHQPDTATAKAGQELANCALQLRIYSLLALGKFYACAVLPNAQLSTASIADRYQHLRESVTDLAQLLAPAELAKVKACF